MYNTLKLSFLSAALVALSATAGFAQSSAHVTVKVPFEFTAGNVTLPAGDYSFQEDHQGIITISSLNTLKSVMLLTNPDNSATEVFQPSVKFDKVNGAYLLTEIDITGQPGRRLVAKTEIASNRPSTLGNRASAAASTKSLK